MSKKTENRDSDQLDTGATPPPTSSVPDFDAGVAAGYTGEPSTFEPEEDVPAGESGDSASSPGSDPGSGSSDGGGTGQRSREVQAMDGDDLSAFQSHWDEFPGHTG
jgi:hypothetical protein